MKTLIDYAMKFVGVPYRWGGDDPMSGMDCSGYVLELLQSVGASPGYDTTANGLYRYFWATGKTCEPKAGALAFFGTPSKIVHVGFCIDNFRMIEAGGGGSSVRNEEDAIRKNAYIRIRPINNRKDFAGCLMPDYNKNVIRLDDKTNESVKSKEDVNNDKNNNKNSKLKVSYQVDPSINNSYIPKSSGSFYAGGKI